MQARECRVLFGGCHGSRPSFRSVVQFSSVLACKPNSGCSLVGLGVCCVTWCGLPTCGGACYSSREDVQGERCMPRVGVGDSGVSRERRSRPNTTDLLRRVTRRCRDHKPRERDQISRRGTRHAPANTDCVPRRAPSHVCSQKNDQSPASDPSSSTIMPLLVGSSEFPRHVAGDAGYYEPPLPLIY